MLVIWCFPHCFSVLFEREASLGDLSGSTQQGEGGEVFGWLLDST